MAKDHYIPQFYLRNFEIPGRTGWVYSYRRGMKPLPKAIRSIACEEDYYDFKTVAESMPVDNFDRLLRLTEDQRRPLSLSYSKLHRRVFATEHLIRHKALVPAQSLIIL